MKALFTHGRALRGCAILAALASSLCFAAVALRAAAVHDVPQDRDGSGGQAELFGAATGCHATFDRFVVRGRLATPGYDVRYVSKIVADGSGQTIGCWAPSASASSSGRRGPHEQRDQPLPSTLTPKCSNLRQVKKAGDFEGVVSYGLGLSRKTGFRVFRLSGPTRVVIDVAH